MDPMDLTDGIDQFLPIGGKGEAHTVGPASWRHLPHRAQRVAPCAGSPSLARLAAPLPRDREERLSPQRSGVQIGGVPGWVHAARALTPRGPDSGGWERMGVLNR